MPLLEVRRQFKSAEARVTSDRSQATAAVHAAGQEAVWLKVMPRWGVSREELQAHFGGPAFLAWQRMGNIHSYAGPLPLSWIEDQAGAFLEDTVRSYLDKTLSEVLWAGVCARIKPDVSMCSREAAVFLEARSSVVRGLLRPGSQSLGGDHDS